MQKAVADFGIDPQTCLNFGIGMKVFLTSAIGPISSHYTSVWEFYKLFRGFYEMDTHFGTLRTKNMPVIAALIGIWYTNFLDRVLKPSFHWSVFAPICSLFQQGNMESNGKSTDRNGRKVQYETGPIVWGEPHQWSTCFFISSSIKEPRWYRAILLFCNFQNPLGNHHILHYCQTFCPKPKHWCKARRKFRWLKNLKKQVIVRRLHAIGST